MHFGRRSVGWHRLLLWDGLRLRLFRNAIDGDLRVIASAATAKNQKNGSQERQPNEHFAKNK